MKKNCCRSLFLCAALCLGALPAQAQPKIALIDLKKVFDNYYKTKQADGQIKERAADFTKTGQSMLEDYRKANEEYKKLLESANDQAVSAEEREKRNKSASAKLVELKEIEQNVRQFDKQSQTLLEEQKRRARDRILNEIREAITTKGRSGGFLMVLDSSAETLASTPVLLYNNGENDLTDVILKQLNAGAPPDLLKTDEPKENKDNPGGKKDEKKNEKK